MVTLKWLGILISVMLCNEIAAQGRNDDFSPDTFFEEFGYLDNIEKDQPVSHSPSDRERAIRHFQKILGLPETGELNPKLINKMKGSRCGVKDLKPPRSRRDPNGPLEFYAVGSKWKKDTLTWTFQDYTRQLNSGIQRRAISNAFAKWSAVTNLNFREVGGNEADIKIRYGRRNHNDNYAFDGRGGTLAHAFFPGSGQLSGQTHFDDDEKWTMDTDEGTNLEIVAAHEFGHALGLSHSQVSGALMAPYYAGYDPNYGLHRDDIQGIQSLYGIRRNRPQTTRRPTTRRPTTRRPTTRRPTTTDSNVCNLKFDAVYRGYDGGYYAVRDYYTHRFNRGLNGFDWSRRSSKVMRGTPKSPGAIVQDRSRTIYIFKGKRYWKFTRGVKVRGYPKVLKGETNWYRNVHAAVQGMDGEIYVFKGGQYSIWRETYRTPPQGYPRWFNDRDSKFKLLNPRNQPLTNLEAAIRIGQQTFFFKGRNYFKYDERYRRMMPGGYPRAKEDAWLGCGRSPK